MEKMRRFLPADRVTSFRESFVCTNPPRSGHSAVLPSGRLLLHLKKDGRREMKKKRPTIEIRVRKTSLYLRSGREW